jgi:hypothetical protein
MGLLARRKILTITAGLTPTIVMNTVIRIFRPNSGRLTGMAFGVVINEA